MRKKSKLLATIIVVMFPVLMIISKFVFSLQISWMDFWLSCICSLLVFIIINLFDIKSLVKNEIKLIELANATKMTQKLFSFLDSYRKIYIRGDNLFLCHVDGLYKLITDNLRNAANGSIKIKIDTEHTNYVLLMMEETKESLDATIIWSEDTLFKKRRGSNYKDATKNALQKNGAKVRRIYIVEDFDKSDKKLTKSIKEDIDMGVEVKWCLINDWEAGHSDKFAVDFGIFDKKRVWKYERKITGVERTAQIDINQTIIDGYQEMFNANWVISNEVINSS